MIEAFSLKYEDLPDLDAHRDELDAIAAAAGADITTLIQTVQGTFGFLPRNALAHISRHTGTPLAQLYGIATFYTSFALQPRGKHIVRVCDGTACHVRGSARITDALSERLRIAPGDTTKDRLFTLDVVSCVGCCSLAPVIMVGERSHGRLDKQRAIELIETLADSKVPA